ncbi:MAG: hypothetical protein ACE5FP_01505 [Gemmatimonadota bacterium]
MSLLVGGARAAGGQILALTVGALAFMTVAGGSHEVGTPAARQCAEPFEGIRSGGTSYFVATAREDTVEAGESMFGQAADVSQIGGFGTDRETGLAGTDRTVLLVPWGFNDQCAPIQWTGSWRWSPTGTPGFYRGRVRPPASWADGRPTVDIFGAVWEGFPNSPWEHPMADGLPKLTASELFDLYRALPTGAEVAERPYGAVSELVDWRREAGARAASYPARVILESAFRLAEIARVRKSSLAFAGTYRVHLESDGDTLDTFLLRTGEGGSEPWPPSAGTEEVASAPAPTGALAAPTAIALTRRTLDTAASRTGPSRCVRLLGLRVVEEEIGVEDAARAWSAEIPLAYVATCFDDREHLKDLRPAQTSPPSAEAADGRPFSGSFRQEKDGRFTFRQPASLADGTQVTLQGERVGFETLPWVNPINPVSP